MPIYGIRNSDYLTAYPYERIDEPKSSVKPCPNLSRVGVIAASTRRLPRRWRSYHTACLGEFVAGERAVNLGVDESDHRDLALDKLIATGRALRGEDGVAVIVLRCAGMTPLRADIEAALGVPVIDPCSTAASFAFSVCRERGIASTMR